MSGRVKLLLFANSLAPKHQVLQFTCDLCLFVGSRCRAFVHSFFVSELPSCSKPAASSRLMPSKPTLHLVPKNLPRATYLLSCARNRKSSPSWSSRPSSKPMTLLSSRCKVDCLHSCCTDASLSETVLLARPASSYLTLRISFLPNTFRQSSTIMRLLLCE